MEEHFVNYNQALALRELGFDETSFAGYELIENGELWIGNIGGSEQFNRDYYIPAPLKSQVFKWFRDKHQLNCKIEFDKFITEDADDNELENPYFTYLYSINELWIEGKDFFKFQNGWNNITSKREFISHEEAESACIDQLISILKERKA